MVEVVLSGELAALAGGERRMEIEARTIREMFRRLTERCPALETRIGRDVAVAIDGEIYRDNWATEIPEGAEVYLMRRLVGG
jgi:molybdopterin synthase sulfur carrier subunit